MSYGSINEDQVIRHISLPNDSLILIIGPKEIIVLLNSKVKVFILN